MSSHIHGIRVQVAVETVTGHDALNAPIISTSWEYVDNVLVGQPTTQEQVDSHQLYGKRIAYVLAIPKGDTHNWTDTRVILPPPMAGEYKTFGLPTAGIEENIPLDWNIKVNVEAVS